MRSGLYRTLQLALKRSRLNAGLTQEELAKRLKKPQSFVSKYEQGERRLDVLEFAAVAQALDLDPSAFLRDILN